MRYIGFFLEVHCFSLIIVICRVNSENLGEWSSWSVCSKNCGTGIKTRIRSCSPVSECSDSSVKDTAICNTKICPKLDIYPNKTFNVLVISSISMKIPSNDYDTCKKACLTSGCMAFSWNQNEKRCILYPPNYYSTEKVDGWKSSFNPLVTAEIRNNNQLDSVSGLFKDLKRYEDCYAHCRLDPLCKASLLDTDGPWCYFMYGNLISTRSSHFDAVIKTPNDGDYNKNLKIISNGHSPSSFSYYNSAVLCFEYCKTLSSCFAISFNDATWECNVFTSKKDLIIVKDTSYETIFYVDETEYKENYGIMSISSTQVINNVNSAFECRLMCLKTENCIASEFIFQTCTLITSSEFVLYPQPGYKSIIFSGTTCNDTNGNTKNCITNNYLGKRLENGIIMKEGQYLEAKNGSITYRLNLKHSGDLVLYKDSTVLWKNDVNVSLSNTGPFYAFIDTDGIFAIYDANDLIVWQVKGGISAVGNYAVQLDGNGHFSIYLDSTETWSLISSISPVDISGSSLSEDQKLWEGNYLQVGKDSTAYQLHMESNGSLVLYSGVNRNPHDIIWSSGSIESTHRHPFYLTMQSNGKLIVYDSNDFVIWYAIGTSSGSGSYSLQLTVNGSLVIMKGNIETWSINSLPPEEGPTMFYSDEANLRTGSCIQSRNRLYRLCLQRGNILVMYERNQIFYYLQRNGRKGDPSLSYRMRRNSKYYMTVTSRGDLVIKESDNYAWFYGKPVGSSYKYRLVMQEDRLFAVYGENSALWYSSTDALPQSAIGSRLDVNVPLYEGQYIQNDTLILTMQYDGNLVLYTESNTEDNNNNGFRSNTRGDNHNHPYYCILRPDGNFVIYDRSTPFSIYSINPDYGIVWQSNRFNSNAAALVLNTKTFTADIVTSDNKILYSLELSKDIEE